MWPQLTAPAPRRAATGALQYVYPRGLGSLPRRALRSALSSTPVGFFYVDNHVDDGVDEEVPSGVLAQARRRWFARRRRQAPAPPRAHCATCAVKLQQAQRLRAQRLRAQRLRARRGGVAALQAVGERGAGGGILCLHHWRQWRRCGPPACTRRRCTEWSAPAPTAQLRAAGGLGEGRRGGTVGAAAGQPSAAALYEWSKGELYSKHKIRSVVLQLRNWKLRAACGRPGGSVVQDQLRFSVHFITILTLRVVEPGARPHLLALKGGCVRIAKRKRPALTLADKMQPASTHNI